MELYVMDMELFYKKFEEIEIECNRPKGTITMTHEELWEKIKDLSKYCYKDNFDGLYGFTCVIIILELIICIMKYLMTSTISMLY